jgi:hypothetical protein
MIFKTTRKFNPVMKYSKMFIVTLFLITLSISCKKEETDDRDKFIGTWHGVIDMDIPGLHINSATQSTQIITKGTDPKQIIITEAGETSTASANSKTYTYDEYTRTETIGGQTTSVTVTGNGSIYNNVNVITEIGTIKVISLGQEYPGTWTCIRYKQ